jgi:hypothetical protein
MYCLAGWSYPRVLSGGNGQFRLGFDTMSVSAASVFEQFITDDQYR